MGAADLTTNGLALASVATLFWLYRKHAAGAPLLPYEPRRPVPWNYLAVTLALAPALAAIGRTAGAGHAASDPISTISAEQMGMFALTHVFLALVCYTLLTTAFHADGLDLGLPRDSAQLLRDVGAGTVAYLAVLLPVYGIQFALISLLAPQDVHPIIEQLQTNYSPGLMAAAWVGAVIGAPLFEETAFRLIFQGWLEKHEGPPKRVQHDEAEGTEGADAAVLPGPSWDDAHAQPTANAEGEVPVDSLAGETLALADFTPDRPCNWAAIVVSSSLFALAHIGQGVAPFSLFPLGLALGYLYQRTHRIVPSMVCHALFNATTMLMLWLELSGGTQ